MKFVLVQKGRVEEVNLSHIEVAMRCINIKSGDVDFAVAAKAIDQKGNRHGIGIVVGQFGLYEDPKYQHYFSIGYHLYAGNAVLYAFDAAGETIDMMVTPPVMFYRNADVVEDAIENGEIERPEVKVNNDVVWQWKGRK